MQQIELSKDQQENLQKLYDKAKTLTVGSPYFVRFHRKNGSPYRSEPRKGIKGLRHTIANSQGLESRMNARQIRSLKGLRLYRVGDKDCVLVDEDTLADHIF